MSDWFYGQRGEWEYCHDCRKPYLRMDRKAHMRLHISRPSANHYTLQEAGAILRMSKGEVNHAVRTKRLDVLRAEGQGREGVGRGRGNRVWVLATAIAAFAQAEMQDGGVETMRRLTEPEPVRRRQDWMPMPEKKAG